MEKKKQINATVTNEELHQVDAGKKPGGKIDKGDIVDMISQLPVKERMDFIRDLQNAASTDADYFSAGREGNSSHYDTLRDGYQKKAKEVDEQQPAETK